MPRAQFICKQRPQPFKVGTRPIHPSEWLRRSELVALDGRTHVVVHPGRGACIIQDIETGETVIVGSSMLPRMTRKTIVPNTPPKKPTHDTTRSTRVFAAGVQMEFGL